MGENNIIKGITKDFFVRVVRHKSESHKLQMARGLSSIFVSGENKSCHFSTTELIEFTLFPFNVSVFRRYSIVLQGGGKSKSMEIVRSDIYDITFLHQKLGPYPYLPVSTHMLWQLLSTNM